MARLKSTKVALGSDLAEAFNGSNVKIVAHYQGISAGEIAGLRRDLHAADCDFKVVKNRVALKAIQIGGASESEGMGHLLKGPTGVALLRGDVAKATKVMFDFSKDHENFRINGGVMDGKALTAAELEKIASLPPKEVLIAKIIGCLIAPHRNLLYVLNGVSTKLVRTVGAIRDTKQA